MRKPGIAKLKVKGVLRSPVKNANNETNPIPQMFVLVAFSIQIFDKVVSALIVVKPYKAEMAA